METFGWLTKKIGVSMLIVFDSNCSERTVSSTIWIENDRRGRFIQKCIKWLSVQQSDTFCLQRYLDRRTTDRDETKGKWWWSEMRIIKMGWENENVRRILPSRHFFVFFGISISGAPIRKTQNRTSNNPLCLLANLSTLKILNATRLMSREIQTDQTHRRDG
jgi:hypothetical protein